MTKKAIKRAEYQNIPVPPQVYAQVRLLADQNERSMGGQVAAWVRREMPECGHKKQGVDIMYAPSAVDSLTLAVETTRTGWYCATCNRVYAVITTALPPPSASPLSPKSTSPLPSPKGEGERLAVTS